MRTRDWTQNKNFNLNNNQMKKISKLILIAAAGILIEALLDILLPAEKKYKLQKGFYKKAAGFYKELSRTVRLIKL